MANRKVIEFFPKFSASVAQYRGVEKVWIGDGTNSGPNKGTAGMLYASYVDGNYEELGYVSDYAEAKDVFKKLDIDPDLTYEKWIEFISTIPENALASEAWAVGTNDGKPVSSSAAQYNNNAKHYSTQTKNLLAPTFANATAYPAGQYVINSDDGLLYVLPNGHTAGATWNSTTHTQVTAGNALTTLDNNKADKADTVLETTLSRGRKANSTVGAGSIAFGDEVVASGVNSHAEGSFTIASGTDQHVTGHFNIEDSNDTYAEIVGNGTANNARSNARTLDWNGNEQLAGKLTVGAGPSANMDVATKQYVDQSFAANDAMIFKGTIGTGGTITSLPASHNAGWTYKVITAGTYAGNVCEVGDLIICIEDRTTANNADWVVAQTNINGAVVGPSSATENNVALFGSSGQVIKDSGVSFSTFPTEETGQDLIVKEQARTELMQTVLNTIEAQIDAIPDPATVIDDTTGSGDTDKTWSADKLNDTIYGEIFVPEYTSASTQSTKYFETSLEMGESYIVHTDNDSLSITLTITYYVYMNNGDGTYELDTFTDNISGIYEGREVTLRSSSDTDGRRWTIHEMHFHCSASPLNFPAITFQKETPSLKQTLKTEAWAVGKRNGYNVSSSDETYHNNAKYYAEHAAEIVTPSLENKADKADTVLDTTLSRDRKPNTTVGAGSIAFGENVEAQGYCSQALGIGTATYRNGGHAEGKDTVASGKYSHAEGQGTYAYQTSQHVQGEYNIYPEMALNTRGIYAEIVGNGTADNARSNARALEWAGNERLAGTVYVGCNADSTGGNKVLDESDMMSEHELYVMMNTIWGLPYISAWTPVDARNTHTSVTVTISNANIGSYYRITVVRDGDEGMIVEMAEPAASSTVTMIVLDNVSNPDGYKYSLTLGEVGKTGTLDTAVISGNDYSA